MQEWFDTIEKELEDLRKQYEIGEYLPKDSEDIYNLGINSGICKALALVHKINIDYINSK